MPEPHNTHLLTLLYRMAEWHALAKLRMQTEATLNLLDKATVTIGKELRSFRDSINTAYTCKELPSEASRRTRQQIKKNGSKQTADTTSTSDTSNAPPVPISSSTTTPPPELSTPPLRTKLLNLCTYNSMLLVIMYTPFAFLGPQIHIQPKL